MSELATAVVCLGLYVGLVFALAIASLIAIAHDVEQQDEPTEPRTPLDLW